MLKWLFPVILSSLGYTMHAQAGNPMNCTMKGKVLYILKPHKAANKSLCSKYACNARVQILSVTNCGSSVTATYNVGDTIIIHFNYTLSPTRRTIPAMKTHYPGLKKGNKFSAQLEQRLLPGGKYEFIVNDYTLN